MDNQECIQEPTSKPVRTIITVPRKDPRQNRNTYSSSWFEEAGPITGRQSKVPFLTWGLRWDHCRGVVIAVNKNIFHNNQEYMICALMATLNISAGHIWKTSTRDQSEIWFSLHFNGKLAKFQRGAGKKRKAQMQLWPYQGDQVIASNTRAMSKVIPHSCQGSMTLKCLTRRIYDLQIYA